MLDRYVTYFVKFAWILLVALFCIGYYWYFYEYAATKDAYVYNNVTNISSISPCTISKVYVEDNSFVKKGQKIFSCDLDPFENKLQKALAQLKIAKIDYKKHEQELEQLKLNIDSIKTQKQAATDNMNRFIKLYSDKAISEKTLYDSQTKVRMLKDQVNVAESKLLLGSQQHQALESGILEAEANYKQAEYELTHAVVIAPHDGYINNMFIKRGDYISAGPLFALIPIKNWQVIANFRETVLRLININDKVKIKLDMYPGVVFEGKVISISRGVNRREASSSVAASTLEYVQQKEDWIKLSQRFSVRIQIADEKNHKMYIGASAKVIA